MKKLMTIFGVMLFATLILTSCGSSAIESDAKKVAELQCKALKLLEKVTSGETSTIEESTKLAAETEALSKEMEKKYSSDSDKQKFALALMKEIGKCK